jgi:hypothetical protein
LSNFRLVSVPFSDAFENGKVIFIRWSEFRTKICFTMYGNFIRYRRNKARYSRML